MIPKEVIEEVRSQANIADVIGQYVHLKRSGKNLFALCPFHKERVPSFSVSPDKQIFHCFSCGRGGNVFQFLMDLKNISFPQAVAEVAKTEGVNVSQYMNYRRKPRINQTNYRLIKIYNQVAKMYHHILVDTEVGEPALRYLHKRGLTDKTIDTYNLGFAPRKSLLKSTLLTQGITADELRRSGLFTESRSGKLVDRFFDRVMYPIRNIYGQTIAFSGRVLKTSANPAKYLNSPETPIFHKRNVLFNLDLAKKAVRKEHCLILYEGFMDVMSSYQSGVKNGIASMGTSLTDNQIYLIQKNTDRVYVCYDGDTPGQKAINRALNILSAHSHLKLGVVQMPQGIDPDEYRQKFGETKFKHYISSAHETPTTFKLNFMKRGRNFDNEQDQADYLNVALQVIAKVRNSVNQDVYLNTLSKEFDVDKAALKARLRSVLAFQSSRLNTQEEHFTRRPTPSAPAFTPHHYLSRTEMAERLLLNRMLHDHNVWLRVTSIKGFSFVHEKYQMLYLIAQGYLETHHNHFDIADFVSFVKEASIRRLAIQIDNLEIPDQIHGDEINDYVKIIIDRAPLEQKIKHKRKALNEACRLNDFDQEVQLTQDLIKLNRKKQT